MKKYKNVLLITGLVVFYMVLSMIWYSMFATDWLTLSRITAEQAMGISPLSYVVAIVAGGAAAYGLLWLFDRLKINSAQEGAKFALLLSLAFFFLEVVTIELFSVRPLKLAFINGGVYVLYMVVAGAVLGGWRKN